MVYPGLKDDKKLADVIAYLKHAEVRPGLPGSFRRIAPVSDREAASRPRGRRLFCVRGSRSRPGSSRSGATSDIRPGAGFRRGTSPGRPHARGSRGARRGAWTRDVEEGACRASMSSIPVKAAGATRHAFHPLAAGSRPFGGEEDADLALVDAVAGAAHVSGRLQALEERRQGCRNRGTAAVPISLTVSPSSSHSTSSTRYCG